MMFTQFKFPNAKRFPAPIDVPPDIEEKARDLTVLGWSFEIEIFPDTQVVHMDCCDDEEQLANEVCANGPDVPKRVGILVTNAHKRWVASGRPRAVGSRAGAGERVRAFDWEDPDTT